MSLIFTSALFSSFAGNPLFGGLFLWLLLSIAPFMVMDALKFGTE